jgi:nitrogenase molybdenum-iron protein beta chain
MKQRAEEGRLNDFPQLVPASRMGGAGKGDEDANVDDIKPCYPLFATDDYKASPEQAGSVRRSAIPRKRWRKSSSGPPRGIPGTQLQARGADHQSGQGLPAAGRRAVRAGLLREDLPYVHGSQGCVAYFRTYFNRHFKEPICCVSDSMTEDAAVFGGQKNMFDGLENAKAIYKPEMIAVSTTCMAEVIGDDLNAFINNAKKEGRVPMDFPVPFAHTPSFVGSHVTGWDNMFEGIMRYFTLNTMDGQGAGQQRQAQHRSRLRDLSRQLPGHQADAERDGRRLHLLSDPRRCSTRRPTANSACTPAAPRRTRSRMRRTPSHLPAATYQLTKTKKWSRTPGTTRCPSSTSRWGELDRRVPDEGFRTHRQADSRIAGQGARPPGRHDDRLARLAARQEVRALRRPGLRHGHGKILLELGAEPLHVLCHNGNKRWAKDDGEAAQGFALRVNAKAYAGSTCGTCARCASPTSRIS